MNRATIYQYKNNEMMSQCTNQITNRAFPIFLDNISMMIHIDEKGRSIYIRSMFDQTQKQSSRGVLWKKCCLKLFKIHRKAPVLQTPKQVFSSKFWETFKFSFF